MPTSNDASTTNAPPHSPHSYSDAGKYTNTSQPPFPTECVTCESGRYASGAGMSSCTVCDEGKFSNPDRTACSDCGRFGWVTGTSWESSAPLATATLHRVSLGRALQYPASLYDPAPSFPPPKQRTHATLSPLQTLEHMCTIMSRASIARSASTPRRRRQVHASTV